MNELQKFYRLYLSVKTIIFMLQSFPFLICKVAFRNNKYKFYI